MLKIIGYVLSVAGLAVIALAKQIFTVSLVKTIVKTELTIVIAGAVIIAAGIGLVLSESRGSGGGSIKQVAEEVPIYEGEGKNRKIIGYKRGRSK